MSQSADISGIDLDVIERRWSTDGGMGNPRGAEDYTDAGCRIFAEHGFRDVPALIARIRTLKEWHNADGVRWEGFPRADKRVVYCTYCQQPAPCETVRLLGDGDA
ncbi:hypothetical protein SEA_BUDSKI_47 [Gordonia phage Budski]|nr:hypothetical protein SEA_BUDSKI_47 [Gordonia phage Budski]